MEHEELIDRFCVHYEGLISKFAKSISHLDYRGMPEPQLPIIGSCYSRCKYKIAFYGIDTYGWHDMNEFMNVAKANPKEAAILHFDDIESQTCLQWTNNAHSSFWDFVVSFVALFYHVDVKKVRNGEYPDLIHSIIWGDTNSIERYDAQAAQNKVPVEIYNEIKEQSRIFDNSEHLVNIAKPNVVVVLNWGENRIDWFVKEKTNCHYYKINDHLWYYYNRNTQTHIFQTHHPRSAYIRYGFETIIKELFEQFIQCNVWNQLPEGIEDMFEPVVEKSNEIRRNELIADIAGALIKSHSVMCGQQLVDILNQNGITTNDKKEYTGGRGIYRPIKAAWNYYQNCVKDEQIAYNIALSFVNSKGKYAYDEYE